MKTAVINVKVDEKIKNNAQKLAQELGLNLSAVVNGFLKTFVINRRITFDANPSEEPSDFMLEALKEAEEDVKAGCVSPTFTDNDSATKWLKKEVKKYAN